ncbi:YciI family protein [Kibdelosporangium lantanae]
MRFMIIIKSNEETDAGRVPTEAELSAMSDFNQQLVDAGVMLAGEGLRESAKGAKVRKSGGKTTVTDGPFTEAKELVAGFWLIRADSLAEALEWATKVPSHPDFEMNLEVREVVEADYFGDAFTPELQEKEERMRAQAAVNAENYSQSS